MAKPQFTFKNYLKELKKAWLLLAIFFLAGAIGGGIYAFTRPNTYHATAIVTVYNKNTNTGPATSPYAQISDLLMSTELVKTEDMADYTVTEKPFGVFTIATRSTDEKKAIDTANTVADKTNDVIAKAFSDSENYEVTLTQKAEKTTQGVTITNRIISTAISAFGVLALALIIVFIKFDYTADK